MSFDKKVSKIISLLSEGEQLKQALEKEYKGAEIREILTENQGKNIRIYLSDKPHRIEEFIIDDFSAEAYLDNGKYLKTDNFTLTSEVAE